MRHNSEESFPILQLAGLTLAALCIGGYHLGVDDSEIYVPAAKKFLHSELYPFHSEFFLSHGHLTLFSPLLAWTSKLTRMPMDWTLFAWYLATLFGMISACWMLAKVCFVAPRARWSAVVMTTAVLTMPAASTALLLLDPCMTARSFSTPLSIFVLASYLGGRYLRTGAGIILTAAVHPQMSCYLLFLIATIWLVERHKRPRGQQSAGMALMMGALPTGFRLTPATGAYREALLPRDYFFLYNWAWYEWIGLIAPLAILAWFWLGALRGTLPGFKRISFAMIPFGLLSIAAAAVISSSPKFEMLARLQPLRCFHLITLVFILLLAGVAGEYLAKGRTWVIPSISVALAAGMFILARQTYPNSPQIEIPLASSANPWVNALLWVRQNTPTDAVFAVDSYYFKDELNDVHGFRAVAERSSLSDHFKDGGVVSLFPALADEWKPMSDATFGLNHFTVQDFHRLRQEFPAISWTVIHGPAPNGMSCPYNQRGYAVCLIP